LGFLENVSFFSICLLQSALVSCLKLLPVEGGDVGRRRAGYAVCAGHARGGGSIIAIGVLVRQAFLVVVLVAVLETRPLFYIRQSYSVVASRLLVLSG